MENQTLTKLFYPTTMSKKFFLFIVITLIIEQEFRIKSFNPKYKPLCGLITLEICFCNNAGKMFDHRKILDQYNAMKAKIRTTSVYRRRNSVTTAIGYCLMICFQNKKKRILTR